VAANPICIALCAGNASRRRSENAAIGSAAFGLGLFTALVSLFVLQRLRGDLLVESRRVRRQVVVLRISIQKGFDLAGIRKDFFQVGRFRSGRFQHHFQSRLGRLQETGLLLEQPLLLLEASGSQSL
jgi:hypothetical protein